MQIPFIGGMAESSVLSLNAQKSINCFPVVDNKEAKNVLALFGTPGLKFFTSIVAYGSGADGIVTIAANTTLTRDMQYATLTINSGITLNTAGFIVACSGTLTNNGTITDSSSGGVGGAGGSNNSVGSLGSASSIEGGGQGGKGGISHSTTGVGATGGKGGGVVQVFAKVLTNNGVIHADGFVGVSNAVGDGDGACGGDGGSVILIYETRTEGTVRAAAGAHS